MENHIINDLLNLCRSIDEIAAQLYYAYSKKTKSDDLKKFWTDMAKEEEKHISFWDEMINLSKLNIIPQIFDNPTEIKKNLEDIKLKSVILLEKAPRIRRKSDIFVSAIRIEFYLLHPAFYTFLQFYKLLQPEKTIKINYEEHLKNIIDALKNYREETLELDLFGEILNNLLNENKKLVVLSNVDFLTRIYNRRGFFKAVKPLIYLAKRSTYNVGMMMIDVDNFKIVNDKFGHKNGDNVLKMISDIIKKSVRRSDIVGRYGGEEFLIFLAPISADSIYILGEKIRKSIEKESKKVIPVTVSIGISQKIINSISPEDEIELLIKKSDEAMYKAKKEGKNKIIIFNI